MKKIALLIFVILCCKYTAWSQAHGTINFQGTLPGAMFEACAGTSITIRYENLTFVPDAIVFARKGGGTTPGVSPTFTPTTPPCPSLTTGYNTITINMTPAGPGANCGSIVVTVPNDATTGLVRLSGNSGASNCTFMLSVINPDVYLGAVPPQVCSQDIIYLNETPSGGTYALSSGGNPLTVNDYIDPTPAGGYDAALVPGGLNGAASLGANAVSMPVQITYSYQGAFNTTIGLCPAKTYTANTTVYSNDLSSISYANVSNSSNSEDIQIVSSVPAFWTSQWGASPSMFTFYGTHVVTATKKFRAQAAGLGNHPVVTVINNNGCEADITQNLTVASTPNSTLNLCSMDGTYNFVRNPAYPYSSAGMTENNIMQATASQGTISPAVPGNANSTWILDLSSFTGTSVITIRYRNCFTIFGTPICFNNHTEQFTVNVVNPGAVNINPFPFYICEVSGGGGVVPISGSPGGGVFTDYQITGPYAGTSYTLPSAFIDPSNASIEHPSDTLDTQHMLVYTVGTGACTTRDTVFYTIVETVTPDFTGRHLNNTYCTNEPIDLLTPYPAPGAGVGAGTFTINGTPAVGTQFNPATANIGNNTVVYTFTSIHGCTKSTTKTLVVNPLPNVNLATSSANNEFCANVTNVALNGTPSGGTYYGPTILGSNIFNPSLAFGTPFTSGTVQVYYDYTDPVTSCRDTAQIDIVINPISVTTVNNLDTQYCLYEPVANVSASSTFAGTGSFTSVNGGFIGSSGSVYLYLPSAAGAGLDTVRYIHRNMYGCYDTTVVLVKIDTIPVPDILWMTVPPQPLPHPHYCVDAADFDLSASPAPALGLSGVFSGPGVYMPAPPAPQVQRFSPVSAGTGIKQITYVFTDNNGCIGTVTENIEVRPLPPAAFSFPGVPPGNVPQYCVDAPDVDLWEPNEVTGMGTGVFSGPGITNTADGILHPPFFAPSNTGSHLVTYTFTDTFGCVNVGTQNFIINPLPNVSLIGLDAAYCNNTGNIVMQGIPFGPGSQYPQVGTVPSMASIGNGQAQVNTNALANGMYTFHYIYTDNNNCTNRDSIRTEIFPAPSPSIQNLANQYCEVQDSFPLLGLPAGGFFAGSGMQGTDHFKPYRAGPGTHVISYTAFNTHTATLNGSTLTCQATAYDTTVVYPLPGPVILSPAPNTSYCETDPRLPMVGQINSQQNLQSYFYHGVGVDIDTILVPLVIIINGNPVTVFVPDYTYFFSPTMAHDSMGQGVYMVTYVATNQWGCVDSVAHSYSVYSNPTPAFATDTEICEGDGPTTLFGSPGGGVFSLNGAVLNPPIYNPNPNYPITIGTSKYDTLVYTVTNTGFTACIGRDTQIVLVHPNPQLSYVSVDLDGDTTYQSCIGVDTLTLTPNIAGGTFSGPGVLFGTNQFIPGIAGVGAHSVAYSYTESATGCSNTFNRTFYSYNTPKVEFAVDGGCGDEVFVFTPNNGILGLNGLFMGNQYDSITLVRWDFGDGQLSQPGPLPGTVNQLSTASHLYGTFGIYNVSLFVQNNNYCTGTDTVRIIVSPAVTPTATAPYFENFEANNGGWFDEKEGLDTASGIWNWTIATGSRINTVNNPHQKVWVTHGNAPYGQDQSGWVYGPCVDLTQLIRPMIKMDYFSDTDLGNDGVVIEYYDENLNQWKPLGEVDRGINWYNRDVIAGRPGLQDLAPIGWSGEMGAWKTGRYKLDEFRNYDHFRFRVAFGAVGVQNRGLQGFAFDDVWIGNRTRNVLLEHFANIEQGNMININNHVYNMLYNTPLIRDVHLVQYHIDQPSYDEFNYVNQADPAARVLYYGIPQAGRAIIDGKNHGSASALSLYLQSKDFEYDMLESPKFDISIDNFITAGNQVSVSATVTANQAMPQGEYVLQIALVEDSLDYQQTSAIFRNMATLRGLIPTAGGTPMNQPWTAGQQQSASHNWTIPFQGFNAGRFELVVFVQNYLTKEVYQVASTRDLTVFPGYTGIEEVEEEVLQEAAQVSDFKLYPNPAQDHFTVEFEQPLPGDYDWHLVDLRGVRLRSGKAPALITQLSVDGLQDLPTGVYLFVLQGNKFFTQRKVVLRD